MAVKSSLDQYGSVAVAIHWVSALLIVALIASGFRSAGLEEAEAKAAILRVHIPIGATILILTLIRIAWWMLLDRKPAAVTMATWQVRCAHAVHFLFYVLILGMTASGIGMLVLSGAGPMIFGAGAENLPDFWNYKPRIPHGIGARAMIALLVFHAGAALFHHFSRRDRLLQRMWFGAR